MEYKLNDNEIIYMINEESDNYRDILINKYMPIIFNISVNYNYSNLGFDLDDIIQEGMIGLNNAISTFNYNDSSFYTYAILCIKSNIISYIRQCSSKSNKILNECLYDEDIYNYGNLYDDIFLSEYNFISLKNKFDGIDSLVFELKYNSFSNIEICSLLDESLNRINKSICKIKLILRKSKGKLY